MWSSTLYILNILKHNASDLGCMPDNVTKLDNIRDSSMTLEHLIEDNKI